jgi:tripartite-type tricarboxylate transporter receptor subunit TctC
MKKILVFAFSLFLSSVQAKETITILYGWSPSDVAANFHRQIVEEANKIQDKYNFVFDARAGAGGAVAAMFVQNNPSNYILASSSAFYIRPNFFPAESHEINKFKEILPICSAPIVVSSKKYKSWNEVPTDKPLSIGVSGLGITTHLVATEIAKKYPSLVVVPFKSTNEAVVATLGGVTDFSVSFMGDVDKYVNEPKNKIYMLGITGNKTINNVLPLVKQNFPLILEHMGSPAQEFVSTSWPSEKFNEVRSILVKAGRSKAAYDAYSVDFCQPVIDTPDDQIMQWFDKQNTLWKHITSGITLQ